MSLYCDKVRSILFTISFEYERADGMRSRPIDGQHRPKKLDELSYHDDLSARLSALVSLNVRSGCWCMVAEDTLVVLCPRLSLVPGGNARLPSHPLLRAVGCREEDEDHVYAKGALRTGC
jgi:hypothetical protein